MSALLRIAFRNIGRQRRRTALALCALIFGVVAVIALRALSDGFIRLTLDEVVLARTGAVQVHRAGYVQDLHALSTRRSLPYDEAFRQRLLAVPGVRAVTGRILFSGLIGDGRSQTSFVGRGIDPEREAAALPGHRADLVPPTVPLQPGDDAAALLGKQLAESFGAGPDGQARTLTVAAHSARGRANALSVEVKGWVASALPFESRRMATVPLGLAQQLVDLEGEVTEYVVAVERLEDAPRIAADLQAALGPEFEAHTWVELEPYLYEALRRQRVVLGVLVGILFVLVLSVIANTLLTMILERVREIGTMVAVGMRRHQVLRLILYESALLGLAGGAAGAALGVAAVQVAGSVGIPLVLFDRAVVLRPEVSADFVAATVIAAAATATVAALWPSWHASRKSPAEALRTL